VSPVSIGELLRYSLGLSAWKVFGASRWSLRVNPSSGNLHPTECYVVLPQIHGLSDTAAVWHYAPDRHAIEQRCALAPSAADPTAPFAGDGQRFHVALTSIHWREAWKYGERAFRYCQHDLGHAIAAVSLSAAVQGWRVTMARGWTHDEIGALTGIDRDTDYVDAEREEPGCLLIVHTAPAGASDAAPEAAVDAAVSVNNEKRQLLDAVRAAVWTGAASQLSEDHVQWTFIDDVAAATRGEVVAGHAAVVPTGLSPAAVDASPLYDRALLLQRRSAVAFDGRSSIDRTQFLQMLRRTMPGAAAPWDAVSWSPRIHFALFVHRVIGLDPGLYFFARDVDALARFKGEAHAHFAWAPVDSTLPLFLLQTGDHRLLARRVSCDQDIASDGFFSLGMIAEFNASLAAHGPAFYRNLFWESGAVGQVLYLEVEAAGARATGIGCFFDDAVHEALGLRGHAFQSLYHFTIGAPVEDGRLTTEPGYVWERAGTPGR
jgi:SagB-type dehydrogenase family enzyme